MKTSARRLIATGGVLALAAGTLAACAPEPVPSWTPQTWSAVGEVLDESPGETVGDVPTMGMRLQGGDVPVDARWEQLPGQNAFNQALASIVRDAVNRQATASGAAYRPTAHPAGAGLGDRGCSEGAGQRTASDLLGERSGTVVDCEIVLARGNVFAERIRAVSAEPDGAVADSATTVYVDISTGQVATGAELIADPASLWSAFVEVLRRDAGALSTAPVAAPDETQRGAFEAAVAASVLVDGEVLIPIPDGLEVPDLDGLHAWRERGAGGFVALPASASDGLSPLAQAISAAQGEFAGKPSAGAGFEWVPCDLVACMALTFDDGPSSFTPGFLDTLRDHEAAATFYMLGQQANAYPDTVRRVAAEGHEVGNHTWNHPWLTKLPPPQISDQLGRTAALLRELSGQPVATFRPPGGFVDSAVLGIAGEPAIMWSVDTRDWTKPPEDELLRYAVDTPNVSSIMLMHDIQEGTSHVIDRVLTGLRDRGFQLVTIDALFDGSVPLEIVRHGPLR